MRSSTPVVRCLAVVIALVAASERASADEVSRVSARSPKKKAAPCASAGDPPYLAARLELCISVRFESPRFGKPIFLRSIEAPVVSIEGTTSYPVVTAVDASAVRRWRVTMDLDAQPPRGEPVRVAIGERRWEIDLGKLSWLDRDGHAVTRGVVELTVADPSYPLIRSARMLAGDTSSSSLLEVVVDNRSEHAVAVQSVKLYARRDGGFQCANGEEPNPIQTVTVNWPRAIAGSGDGQTTMAAASTVISGVTVPVEAGFRAANCGSYDDEFWLVFPVQDELAAGGVTRLVYLLEEEHADGDLGALLPDSLRDWDAVTVSVEADEPLRPSALPVRLR